MVGSRLVRPSPGRRAMRPNRPWPYWYELRMEWRGSIRRDFWYQDLLAKVTMPFTVWLSQRAERRLFEVIPPDVLREVMIQWKRDNNEM